MSLALYSWSQQGNTEINNSWWTGFKIWLAAEWKLQSKNFSWNRFWVDDWKLQIQQVRSPLCPRRDVRSICIKKIGLYTFQLNIVIIMVEICYKLLMSLSQSYCWLFYVIDLCASLHQWEITLSGRPKRALGRFQFW